MADLKAPTVKLHVHQLPGLKKKKKKKQTLHHTITQGTSQCHCNGLFISAVLAAGYFGPGGPSNGVNLSNKFYLKYARGRQVVQAK